MSVPHVNDTARTHACITTKTLPTPESGATTAPCPVTVVTPE